MQNIIQNKSKIFLFNKKDIKNLKNLAKNSETLDLGYVYT